MRKTALIALVLCLSLIGCATMKAKNRLSDFSEIADAYEKALRFSDYVSAAKFVEPTVAATDSYISGMKDFKIVEYNVTRVNVSENMMEITQEVEFQYFRLNSNILHTARDSQIWRFHEDGDVWRLQTGLPVFKP